jgi:hypothetical protein
VVPTSIAPILCFFIYFFSSFFLHQSEVITYIYTGPGNPGTGNYL